MPQPRPLRSVWDASSNLRGLFGQKNPSYFVRSVNACETAIYFWRVRTKEEESNNGDNLRYGCLTRWEQPFLRYETWSVTSSTQSKWLYVSTRCPAISQSDQWDGYFYLIISILTHYFQTKISKWRTLRLWVPYLNCIHHKFCHCRALE